MLRFIYIVAAWLLCPWMSIAAASAPATTTSAATMSVATGPERVEESTQLAEGELKETQAQGNQTEGPLETVWLQSNTDPIIRYEVPFAKVEERSPVLAEYFRTYAPTLTLDMDLFYSDKDITQIQRYLVFGLVEGEPLTLGTQRFLRHLKVDRAKDFQMIALQSARNRSSGKPALTCPLSAGSAQASPYFHKHMWHPDGKLRAAFTVPGSDSKSLYLFAYLLFWGHFSNPFFVRDQFMTYASQSIQPMIEAYQLPIPYLKLQQLNAVLRGIDKEKVPWDGPDSFWDPFLAASEYGQVEEKIVRTFSTQGPCQQALTGTYKPYQMERTSSAAPVILPEDVRAYAPAGPDPEAACRAYMDAAYENWKKKFLFTRAKKTHLGHFLMKTDQKTTKPKGATVEEKRNAYLSFDKDAVLSAAGDILREAWL